MYSLRVCSVYFHAEYYNTRCQIVTPGTLKRFVFKVEALVFCQMRRFNKHTNQIIKYDYSMIFELSRVFEDDKLELSCSKMTSSSVPFIYSNRSQLIIAAFRTPLLSSQPFPERHTRPTERLCVMYAVEVNN
jgi:hypothetical protein